MAVAKRQGRETPTKTNKGRCEDWSEEEQTVLLASPVYTGQAQWEKALFCIEYKPQRISDYCCCSHCANIWEMEPASRQHIQRHRDEETVETVADFIFGDSKITADGDCSHEIKRRLLLGRKVDQPRQLIKKQRHYFTNKGPSS